MSMNTLDISKHQGSFSAGAAKAAGVEAVILRHAYGTTPDAKALGWAGEIRAQGLMLGGYGFATWHYKSLCSGSADKARALMQAQVSEWARLAAASGADWWFAIDQELEAGQVMGLTMTDNTALLREAAALLRRAGLQPCLYCSAAWDMQYVCTADLDMPYWMARYYDGAADFGAPGARLEALGAGRYTSWMRQLHSAGKLAGWQFGSTGLGRKYGAASAGIDRSVFYFGPEGYRQEGCCQGKPQSQAAFVAVGPLSRGDEATVVKELTVLELPYSRAAAESGLGVIVTDISCSPGDQARLIQLATKLCVPVQLLESAEDARRLLGNTENSEKEPQTRPEGGQDGSGEADKESTGDGSNGTQTGAQGPQEQGYSVVFLGMAVKGGFGSEDEAKEYIEAVLGRHALELYRMRLEPAK